MVYFNEIILELYNVRPQTFLIFKNRLLLLLQICDFFTVVIRIWSNVGFKTSNLIWWIYVSLIVVLDIVLVQICFHSECKCTANPRLRLNINRSTHLLAYLSSNWKSDSITFYSSLVLYPEWLEYFFYFICSYTNAFVFYRNFNKHWLFLLALDPHLCSYANESFILKLTCIWQEVHQNLLQSFPIES